MGVNSVGQGKISDIDNDDSAYPLRVVVNVIYKILGNKALNVPEMTKDFFLSCSFYHSITVNQNSSMKKCVIKLRKVRFQATDWHTN